MIGLSLSFCVMDIIAGKVDEADVELIISGTAAKTPEDWDKVIEGYRASYWLHSPAQGERIARMLINNGRVWQPRVLGVLPLSLSGGHWLERKVV